MPNVNYSCFLFLKNEIEVQRIKSLVLLSSRKQSLPITRQAPASPSGWNREAAWGGSWLTFTPSRSTAWVTGALTSIHHDSTWRSRQWGVPRTEQQEKKRDKTQKDKVCSIHHPTNRRWPEDTVPAPKDPRHSWGEGSLFHSWMTRNGEGIQERGKAKGKDDKFCRV